MLRNLGIDKGHGKGFEIGDVDKWEGYCVRKMVRVANNYSLSTTLRWLAV